MKLKKLLASILCICMVLGTMSFTVSAEEYVAEVGGIKYTDIQSALKAINADNNVFELLANVTIDYAWDNRYTGAKITVPVTINGNGNTLEFTGAIADGGNYHSVFRFEKEATVKNLTFDMSQATTENNRFRAIAAKLDLTVEGCTFIGNPAYTNTRGISFGEGAGTAISEVAINIANSNFTNFKTGVRDNENAQDVKSVTVSGCRFTNAGVNVSASESVEFTDNEMDGAGVVITTYTSADKLSVVATGNTLDTEERNNIKAAVIEAQEGFGATGAVAEVNGIKYASVQAAVKAAGDGDTVDVLADDTCAVWNSAWNKKNLTINGNNHTITITEKVYSNGNGGAMFRSSTNLTVKDWNVVLPSPATNEMERLATTNGGTFENVSVTGGTFAISILGSEPVVINNCNFTGIEGWAIETEGKAKTASLTISNSTFDDRAVILRGENNKFTDNIIANEGEGVNVLGDSIITGNDFGESTLGIDRGVDVTIEKNIINKVKFSTWLAGDYSNVTVETNTLSDEALSVLNENLDNEVTSVDPVATVNDKAYYTLAEAVAALKEGDTLKLASGEYDGFDVQADNVTITGMTSDAEITINSIPGNAFIGIRANGVLVEGLKFILPEDCVQTGDWTDGFDAVIGYWSKNFAVGSAGVTGYDVKNCTFVNEGSAINVAMFNFDEFEVSGNTFENFNVGIHTMSDGSAMGTVEISNNTFIKVNEPINVYWGRTGGDTDSIAITGNSFVSAKDADEIKITVDDYASRESTQTQVSGVSGIDSIDISGNTFGTETEVVIIDVSTTVSSAVNQALANVENVTVNNKNVAIARIGTDKYFKTIQAAVNAAQDGDVVTILPGTYDESFNVIQKADVDVTIKAENKGDVILTGTINVCGDGRYNGAETLTIENLVFDGSEKDALHNFILDGKLTGKNSYLHNMTVRNCDFIGNGDNSAPVVGVRVPSGGGYNSVLDNCSAKNMFSFADMKGSSSITITNSKFTNMGEGVFNAHHTKEIIFNNNFVDGAALYAVRTGQGSGSFDETSVQMNGNTIYAGTALVLRNVKSTVEMKNNTVVADNLFTLTNADTSTINGYAVTTDGILEILGQENVVIATEMTASFEYVEDGLYNIVLTAADDIYEFVGAEFRFTNTSETTAHENMEYEILGIAGKTSAEKSVQKDAVSDLYTYALRLIDGAERMSGKKLIIGQVKFHGHGTINFDVSYGKVVTTEFATNLGQYYTTEDGTLGSVKIDNNNVLEKKRTVVVNVAYNHALDGTYWNDNQITVTIKDGFGNTDKYGVKDLTSGIAKFEDVQLGRLTVTLEAPGFRKYVYETTLEEGNDPLVLNFWNNVKRAEEYNGVVIDPEEKIEASKEKTYAHNFLVGDIVMDYTVDEYDLAAVTSYYGTYSIDKADAKKYIKYDLNRDGNIDIIDVHYVLHTLNN